MSQMDQLCALFAIRNVFGNLTPSKSSFGGGVYTIVGVLFDNGRTMLLHMNYFGPVHRRGDPAAYKVPCEHAFESFQTWRATNRIPSSQRRFNYWNLFREEFGAYLNSKGYNSRILSSWLEHELEAALANPPPNIVPDERLYLSLVALKPRSDVVQILLFPE